MSGSAPVQDEIDCEKYAYLPLVYLLLVPAHSPVMRLGRATAHMGAVRAATAFRLLCIRVSRGPCPRGMPTPQAVTIFCFTTFCLA